MARKSIYLPQEMWRYAKTWWKLHQLKRYTEARKILLIYKYPMFWLPALALSIFYLINWWPTFDSRSPLPSHPTQSVESKHAYAGLPVLTTNYPNEINLLERIGYAVGYDEDRRNPAWVAFKAPAGDAGKSPKRPSKFNVDPDTQARVAHRDYTRSGYDRGHMAPNYAIATRYGIEAQNQTFLMSNIVPQKPGLNRGSWRVLEMKIAGRDGFANRLDGVWIITGPIYDENVEHLKSGIEIPDAFFKIVIDDDNGTPRVLAFIMPQDVGRKAKPSNYLTSVDEIERLTSLDFMSDLDNSIENQIESGIALRLF